MLWNEKGAKKGKKVIRNYSPRSEIDVPTRNSEIAAEQ